MHTELNLGEFKVTFTIAYFNPLSANPTKWSDILKEFVGYCY